MRAPQATKCVALHAGATPSPISFAVYAPAELPCPFGPLGQVTLGWRLPTRLHACSALLDLSCYAWCCCHLCNAAMPAMLLGMLVYTHVCSCGLCRRVQTYRLQVFAGNPGCNTLLAAIVVSYHQWVCGLCLCSVPLYTDHI